MRRARPKGAHTVIAAAPYLLAFPTIHILAAIAWGGSRFLLVRYLQPTANAVGSAAGLFVTELVGKRPPVPVSPRRGGGYPR
jgi:hypothetical protein